MSWVECGLVGGRIFYCDINYVYLILKYCKISKFKIVQFLYNVFYLNIRH